VASQRPELVAGVLLLSPWSTLAEETGAFVGGLGSVLLWPVSWAMGLDPWDSLAAVASLPADVPVAILSPQDDTMIPHSQHRAVFEASNAHRRVLIPVPDAGHRSWGAMATALKTPGMEDPSGSTAWQWAKDVCERLPRCGALTSAFV